MCFNGLDIGSKEDEFMMNKEIVFFIQLKITLVGDH
jgi:hypothetical protein